MCYFNACVKTQQASRQATTVHTSCFFYCYKNQLFWITRIWERYFCPTTIFVFKIMYYELRVATMWWSSKHKLTEVNFNNFFQILGSYWNPVGDTLQEINVTTSFSFYNNQKPFGFFLCSYFCYHTQMLY